MNAIIGIILVCTAFVLYFLPAFIAKSREHANVVALTVANLFFGWTFLGWVICLVWSLMKEKKVHE